ncbi:UDP-glucose 4-epimerase family protein [Oceanisphaera psychrotolerans]|uniref:Nucleoside-diphosphate sugar epimerase n=1 Tax=Oceanisphaera psychrotolerans TaxID=1414654 RepID=A0A1J4QCF1_9GAMM|nr:SDR family oxidoreductase [Oceanisphaera psychrotolerans]OIN07767.1 nucleoside-diphosphate sugar epimerase [Oceanisphaera psychrotolerans]
MMGQSNVLVTGATGFVGQVLVGQLLQNLRHFVTVALRSDTRFDSCSARVVGDFTDQTDWSSALADQKTVIHTAARAHIMKDEFADPLGEYRKVNVGGTLNLARQAAEAGVRRFIFISSIKVNGEQTPVGKPFTAEDAPAPEDAYGISKWEAEQGLQQLAAETGMEVVIIRPPLVYGPGVKGNFASMNRLVAKGLPLPLGAIHNQRSLVALDNLVDLIITCIDHPAAANQVFLAGDGSDLSTTELLRGVAKAMDKPSRLIPVPAGLLQFAATILGKKAMAQRLLGSLQVDITKTRELLGWTPPFTVEQGLKRCFDDSVV